MCRNVKYLKDQDVVIIEVVGHYHLGKEIETVKKAVSLAIENNCLRLIFDCRKADVTINTMDAYERPTIYETSGMRRGPTKIAIITNEITDNLEFYQTVCMNRGWLVQLFTDYDKAIHWSKA